MTTASEDLLKRITARPDVFNGKPIIRDMRRSSSAEQDSVEEEDILACIAYAHAVIAGDSLAQVSVG